MPLVFRKKTLTHAERAACYNKAFPRYPPLAVSGRWVYGIWEIGNDYRNKSAYYGAYPNSYPERIFSMFPDMNQKKTLHLFSGSYKGVGVRVDLLHHLSPTVTADACNLPFTAGAFSFVMADPSYSVEDSQKYGTPHPHKKQVLHELARIVKPGGHLAWLDIPKPMYKKSEWTPWGTIGVLRSTNHRGRFVFLYERTSIDPSSPHV
jgi:hypothetical protein